MFVFISGLFFLMIISFYACFASELEKILVHQPLIDSSCSENFHLSLEPFQNQEIITPYYEYFDHFPSELWKEIMRRVTLSDLLNLSVVSQANRQALNLLLIGKVAQEYGRIRCEFDKIVISHPQLFASGNKPAFVWPESLKEILSQVVGILKERDKLTYSLYEDIQTLKGEGKDFPLSTNILVNEESFLQRVWKSLMNENLAGGDLSDTRSLIDFSRLAYVFYPFQVTQIAEEDLKYLKEHVFSYMTLQDVNKSRSFYYLNRIFQDRRVVAGLFVGASIICAGTLYAYFDQVPMPLDVIRAHHNMTGVSFENIDNLFRKNIPDSCITYDGLDEYGWYHNPPHFLVNPQWKKVRGELKLVGEWINGTLRGFMDYLSDKYPQLNTRSLMEFIREAKRAGPSLSGESSTFCVMDLNNTSLTCGECLKENNNLDFHLRLVHIGGECAQNKWISSLINLAFLSVETLSFPLGMMVASFFCEYNSYIKVVTVSAALLAMHWLYSILFIFIR